jgi:two-component system response regulator NreC
MKGASLQGVCAQDSSASESTPGEKAPDSSVIRIVLADDHVLVRSGLRLLLERERDLTVVAEANDTEGARRNVRAHGPAVLVLDLNMPGDSALASIAAIRQESPDTQIVVLTAQREPDAARQALQSGALGYVLKDAANTELVEAVRRAARRDAFLDPRLGARLASETAGPRDTLSKREIEVLRLIALGHTNAEIARQLYLSVRTVEAHRSHIQAKLDISSRAELVGYALEHGLLGAE